MANNVESFNGSDTVAKAQGWMSHVVRETGNLIRLLVLITATVVILCFFVGLTVYLLMRLTESARTVELKMNNGVFSILLHDDKELQALVPLPASAGWINSGVVVPPKSSVSIEATGRVTLAIHHIVDAAKKDCKPKSNWIGPEGDSSPLSGKYARRREKLVFRHKGRDTRIGCVIACLKHPNENNPSLIYYPRPRNMWELENGKGEIFNDKDYPRELWFTVNDIVLDKDCRDVYVGDKPNEATCTAEAKNDYVKSCEAWTEIEKSGYWNIWFDDNVGHYFLKLKIAK